MADEHREDRTYDPTPRRLEQAREEGQVARSPELATATLALCAAIAAALAGPALFRASGEFLGARLVIPREAAFDPAGTVHALAEQASAAFLAAAPWLALLFAAALVGPLLLSGAVLSLKAIAPDFKRIDPLSGLTRMFSWRSLTSLGVAAAKCAVLGVIAWLCVTRALPELAMVGAADIRGGVGRVGDWLAFAGFSLTAGIAAIALVDVPARWWRHRADLKMTREEIREELRESEGDPQLKARIRSLQRAAARKRMMAAVPKATVVVTNPTHYAVALEYREGTMRAPRVVAKGADRIAAKIREIAVDHRVPILEAPPLARALWRHTDIGAEIPQALYAVVARLLAWVWQIERALARGEAPPQRPDDLDVPAGLDPAATAGGPA